MYFCITSLCKFVDSNFLLCNTWTWCRKYWKWSLLLFVELSYRRQSTFANLMLDEYQLQNMDHTRCRSRSCNWVPFSVLCGYISYNHSDDVLPAHLALILDVPGRWAILENTHCYHCSPGVCGYCHGPQQKFWEGCVKVTHSNEIWLLTVLFQYKKISRFYQKHPCVCLT